MLGLIASFQAFGFDSASRSFPLLVSSLLSAAGLAIALGAVFRPVYTEDLGQKVGGAIFAAAVIAAWALALAGGAGFVLSTFAMQMLLLRITGIRRPIHLFGIAALVTALAFLLFVVLLDIPMPPSRLPATLQGF